MKCTVLIVISLMLVVIQCHELNDHLLPVNSSVHFELSIKALSVAIVLPVSNVNPDLVARTLSYVHDSTPVILMDLVCISTTSTVYGVVIWILEMSIDWVRKRLNLRLYSSPYSV